MTTPDNIQSLKENQVFVFGSNLNGNHIGGSAKLALDKFGAIIGQGEGLQGQSYAFPTLDKNMQQLSLEEISNNVEKLYKCAEENKDKQFLVTKVGCGIAGYKENDIKEVFKKFIKPNNIILPAGWSIIKGYKAFNKGLKCRDFQYELGKDFYHEGKIELCSSGFHFCKSLGDVYDYYNFSDDIIVADVETEGEVIDEEGGNKSVTNHLRITRILNAEQASNNNGLNNLGHSNTGHSNTGHSNTGDSNTGNSNTGNWNTGYRNTGNSNTGNWNTGNWNTGFFNTTTPKEILVFGKMCNKEIWDKSEKPSCLYFDVNIWVNYEDMTDKEKKEIGSSKYTGGYMKKLDYKEAFTNSMKNASKEEIEQIKKLPNFDADIFEEISGFRIK